jgi:hypothetical protein
MLLLVFSFTYPQFLNLGKNSPPTEVSYSHTSFSYNCTKCWVSLGKSLGLCFLTWKIEDVGIDNF